MNRIKQSIAVQRQIPEHIRENYPAFVEFVKVYYDFLEQSQAQNLEQIRDIDTTLEEFIDRFKSELAKNIPVELAGDKRLLLKHLREFYLSRGSEASFQFLFNALFSKDSSLFYPSTQILRASDGKWIQEISIFVRLNEGTESLHIASGKFVTINTGTKTLTTFVNAVNQYSNNIFEVYIESQFASIVAIGSQVSVTVDGVTYSGTSLKCPSKVKIYKAGRGFKVGDLFNLKTQLGEGCLIKVTKIDTVGAIKAVQILRFGLAYETTFYSYLSSKDLEAIEYIHPIHTGPYVPGRPAYNERSGGFIDYGFASKQTYMYYDENITVGSNDRRSDRYFADASYVGDIETQFFAEDVKNPIDEDLAIIQVDLGAVARYPGYYSSADGFISDEIYIQDGNYYQAFSYVIRVEEELRKYADIVKALVHPSGMKMFAEYNIFKELKLSAVNTILSNKLQLPLDTNSPSTAYITDGGVNYNQYIATVVNQQITYTPAPNASKVFKSKAAYFMTKRHIDSALANHNKTQKAYTKNIKENVNKLDLIVKHVFKPIAENVNSNADIIIKAYLKKITDNPLQLSKQQKGYTKPLSEKVNNQENISKAYSKNVPNDNVNNSDNNTKGFYSNKVDVINNALTVFNHLQKLVLETNSVDDANTLLFFKNLKDNINNSDSNVSHFYKNIETSLDELLDVIEKYSEKPIDELLTAEETLITKELQKQLQDLIIHTDSSYLEYNKNVFEEQIITHTIEKDIASLKEDALNILLQYEYLIDKSIDDETRHAETHYLEAFKNITESISNLEDKLYFFEKTISETVNIEELISNLVEKPFIDEPLLLNDVFTSLYSKYNQEELTILDLVMITRLQLFEEFFNVQEQYSAAYEKMLIDGVYSIDDDTSIIDKSLEEPINILITGKLRDNPYDSGDPYGYFAYDEDYQPVTLLS